MRTGKETSNLFRCWFGRNLYETNLYINRDKVKAKDNKAIVDINLTHIGLIYGRN